MVWYKYDLPLGEMAHSVDQFSEYILKYPKTWEGKN